MKNLRLKNQEIDYEGLPPSYHHFDGYLTHQIPSLLSSKNEEDKIANFEMRPIALKELLYEILHGDMKLPRYRELQGIEEPRSTYVGLSTGDAVIFDPGPNKEAIIGLYYDLSVRGLVNSIKPGCLPNLMAILEDHSLDLALRINADQYQDVRNNALVMDGEFISSLKNHGSREQQKAKETFLDYVTEGDTELVKGLLSDDGKCIDMLITSPEEQKSGLRLLSIKASSVHGGNESSFTIYDAGIVSGYDFIIGVEKPLEQEKNVPSQNYS